MPLMSPLSLGLRYFAGVFVAGFALGTVRTLWLVPEVGEYVAVRLELPVMLVISVIWCRYLLGDRHLGRGQRAVMGGTAFVWLMLAEFGLGLMLGQTPRYWLAQLTTQAGLTGLIGQLVFAVLPLIAAPPRWGR